MPRGTRPERVAEEIRHDIGELLTREVHDPGIGFVTVTRVTVSPDLQHARVWYTLLGDERAKRDSQRALERAKPFLRRQLGQRIRLRRVPDLTFEFDRSIEHQARIERVLIEIEEERQARAEEDAPAGERPSDDSEGDA
jgi:ribosome-binding factor A